MKFLIQQNLMANDQLIKIEEATRNFPREFVGLVPFSREITSNNPIDGKDFIPYGSTLLTTIGLERGWTGLHFDNDVFTYGMASENRTDMMNAELIIPAKEVSAYLKDFEPTRDIFIRPSQDLKHFSGQVMSAKEITDWLKDAMQFDMSGSYKIDDDLMIVLAEPKVIQAEWRWFVVGGKVISGSMYRAHGQPNKQRELDPMVIYEAQQFADKWLPNPCCVMDLALVDGTMYVIEFNCINSSGFYDNDIPAVFKALYEYNTK